MPIKKHIKPLMAPSEDDLPPGIDYFRERLLLYLLLGLGVFGAIAYLPSIYYGFIYKFYSVIVIDTLALGWVFFLLAYKSLSFHTKSLGLLTVFYILGVWLLVTLGPAGAGFMWMLLFSIMAGMLLGYRPAMVSFGINFITIALLSVLVFRQTISWELIPSDAMAIWTVKGVNFLCINAIVSVSTGFLITKISWMASEEQQRRLILSREMQGRLRAEKEKKELTIRLYQSQKMEAMGTLAGGVAHDFNNILSAIMGYTELSLLNPGLPQPVRKNLNQIIRASERAKGISHQILTFSRHATVHKVSCDLGLIASECLGFFRINIPPGITLDSDIPSRPFPVFADKNQIYQVIMNLLTNSLQALDQSCGKKGRISLTLGWAVPGLNTAPPLSDEETLLSLVVTDTGSGIAPDQLSRVFEPYFTTKKTGEGTGMGLSISHGIVKDHGGDIFVDSLPGKGSTFTVLLPAHGGAAQAVPDSPVPGIGGTEHILMVDDEPHILSIQETILSSLGYRVTAHTSPVRALDQIQENPGEIDLIITDRKMAGMTGIDMKEKISAIAPGLPIILCTGFPQEGDDSLFATVLVKPVSSSELAAIVRQVIDMETVG